MTDAETGAAWERAYSFSRGVAVRRGRPSLVANGLWGQYAFLRAEGEGLTATGTLAVKTGPAGAVVILRDPENVVAPALGRACEADGYGVRLVTWEELDEARVPYGEADLFILADARRVPLAARDAVQDALHGSGKVLCIGAPAFAELLARTPEGWANPAGWRRAYAERLSRTPVQLAATAWQRSSSNPELPSSLAPDPAGGADAWRISAEVRGWDTYRAEVPGLFGPERSLLVLDAKGDAETPQLIVECVEKDSSRWIATVDLSRDWQPVVLRPVDFIYWTDSQAVGRGVTGDRLHTQDVVSLCIGLARSHTPQLQDGPHSYGIRGLATAPDDARYAPDFTVPEVEILSPSYKLYPLTGVTRVRMADTQRLAPADFSADWSQPAYSPVWREQGRGIGRGRSWRWLPVLEALDAQGVRRGSIVSLMVGDGAAPNAVWANVAVAEPRDVVGGGLLPGVVATLRAMTRGLFLLEGGAGLFAYRPGETIVLGAKALNTGKTERALTARLVVTAGDGAVVCERREELRLPPGCARQGRWQWTPEPFDARGYEVTVDLLLDGVPVDRIAHRIEALRTTAARPDEYVRVEGSHFVLGERKWFFRGINYWPTWVAGYPHLNLRSPESYDPEVIERDLAWLQSAGINAISAVQAMQPADPEDARAYRDQLDFLERCDRHGIKVFFFLANGRAYQGDDVEQIKRYITRAGIKDHPAIMCWELAWEPIEGPWKDGMAFLIPDWNHWVVQRYGSAEAATADWGFDPGRTNEGRLPAPTTEQCLKHGGWDRYVAAFRRAFSDLISARYRDIVRPLRQWDPKHLIAFRGGACGIPDRHAFAHIHSIGVAKHMDFLNPEGYNLQTWRWDGPSDPEALRKGGLVTLFYRFLSREKPVVWMEFGFTVNGLGKAWSPERLRILPERLEWQRQELEMFYRMFVESGARGAAPWWLPGGFRLGENSDFGILEPDGTERPAAQVVRRWLPAFETVEHPAPTRFIEADFDQHYADAWETYSAQYLEAVKAGESPYLRTTGTGTDSATCPLTAVGGTPCNGHNPPQYLNAEFNALELRLGDRPWQAVRGGETLTGPVGTQVLCRAAVGNLGEATWLAPAGDATAGRVFLAGRKEHGREFRAPIGRDTPYLGDADVGEFVLIPALTDEVTLSVEMMAAERTAFGERRVLRVKPVQ